MRLEYNPKKGKTLIIIIFVIILVSGCTKQTKSENIERVINDRESMDKAGMIYRCNQDLGALCYYDFESKQAVYLCSKPNCNHTDTLTCDARRARKFLFTYKDNLYYFENNIRVKKNGKVKQTADLYESDISGTKTRKIASVKGCLRVEAFQNNDMIYVICEVSGYKNNLNTNYSELYVNSINLDTHKTTCIDEITKGYNAGEVCYGFTEKKLYEYISYHKKDLDYLKVSEKEYHEKQKKFYGYYDLVKKKLVSLDLPQPILTYQEKYYYNKEIGDNKYHLVARDMNTGVETTIHNSMVTGMTRIGDNIFFMESSGYDEDRIPKFDKTMPHYKYNLKNGKETEYQDRTPEEIGIELLAEYKDEYIVYVSDQNKEIYNQLAYISKKDYMNGMKNYVFVAPPV